MKLRLFCGSVLLVVPAVFAIGACATEVTGRPETLGPILNVAISAPSTQARPIPLSLNGQVRLLLVASDGKISVSVSPTAWVSRNETVVTLAPSGDGTIARGASLGSTYVVGRYVATNGAFVDSVRIVVSAP